jgi:hypothetical protein
MPPISCTSKWRSPMARRAASRTTAKASFMMSSSVSPAARRCLKASVIPRSSASDRACMAVSSALISGTRR